MKYGKLKVTLILLLSALASGAVSAWDGRHDGHEREWHPVHSYYGHPHFRVIIGAPIWRPWYYPAPYYYYSPPVVVTTPSPPVYIEQGSAQAAPASNYWYYCQNPQGYYPYVKECPGGWQQVAPQPPPS